MSKNYLRADAKSRLDRLSIPEPNSGCYLFLGYINEDGYGRFLYEGKRELSHRASYKMHRGEIPGEMQVLHECDNPSCVNPDHLFLGTVDDNMKDMVRKGRQSKLRGDAHPRSKLAFEKAAEIRQYAATGMRHTDIAQKYDVTRPLISSIVRGEAWQAEAHD
jgi:hypothetical protein